MGRKVVIIFSLIFSSLSALGIGLAPSLGIIVAVIFFAGSLSHIGHPAHEAVVADLLPPNKRAEGYGIIRVVFNLAVIIAPPLAGLLISNSYLTLFIVDAVISLICAAIVLSALPETKPQAQAHTKPETMKQTFAGYKRVFKDSSFLAFLGVTVMMTLVYMNMNSTLGVYLRDNHGLPELSYGLLISINALIVVLFQFWVTRRLEKYKPLLMMAAGSILYAIGFAMYGFVATLTLFVIAMVYHDRRNGRPRFSNRSCSFAPSMRGRYMAVSGLSWSISFTVGIFCG
jgi:MFS family permease